MQLSKYANEDNGVAQMAENLDELACCMMGDFFTIFANATRMRIFCALQAGDQTVSQIAEHAGIALPNASQHLRLMRDKGAVIADKRGQSVYYRIADARFIQAALLIRQALLEGIHDRAKAVSSPETPVLHPAHT
jgi:DNA-binding transcriptional ArsR family regulator